MTPPRVSIVVPTIGRPSLATLLAALDASDGPSPERVVVVDDRRSVSRRLPLPPLGGRLRGRVSLRSSAGRGPAAARNVGWRACDTPWVAFLDDDTLPPPDWLAGLARDLGSLPEDVAGSQGSLRVPRPPRRAPTDDERRTIALEGACWATADMAYRRAPLAALGGFDERFRRAYREDADLALRMLGAGLRLVRGTRRCLHPLRPAGRLASLRAQAGNADDVLMDALHGPGWRARASAPPGRIARHELVTAAAALGVVAGAAGASALATLAAAGWLAGTSELAWARIRPGPHSAREIGAMVVTSALLPPLAVWHRLRGRARVAALRRAGALRWTPEGRPRGPLRLVLFDRDGTLIRDPGPARDPARIVPMPTARTALARLREAGIRTAVVTNQPSDRVPPRDVERMNRRTDELLGPFDGFFVCAHPADAGCGCRKPAPGLVHAALERLAVAPHECALVGDIAHDVAAATAAGVRAVMVPTPVTRREEIATTSAPVAGTLDAAVRRLLGETG